MTTHISTGAINGNGPFDATFQGASADGTRVFFATPEQLVASDTDNAEDVYQRFNGVTTRISTGAINGNGAFGASFDGASADGTRVFFSTANRWWPPTPTSPLTSTSASAARRRGSRPA